MNEELSITNEHGRFLGRYRAVVVSNQHPRDWHMAKVRLVGFWEGVPESELPWAEYMLPIGARPREGGILPVQKGDFVWVSFEFGDTRKPIIEGSVYCVDGEGTGESLLPQDAWAKTYDHKRTDKQPPAPEHAYGDKVFDQMGFLKQLTMSGEYCLTHKPSGTAIHVNNKGQLVIHTESDRFDSTTGNKTEEITKNLELIINGNVSETVKGDVVRKIKGSLTEQVGGDYTQKVAGNTNREASRIQDKASQIHHN